MPTIGASFSPQFLSLLVQRGEGDKNRALEAALADRKLKQNDKQMRMGAQQQNIDNQFRAAMANSQTSNDRGKIEAMKEEGRLSRAADANALKQAIARAKLEQKERERETVKVPDVEGKNRLREQRGGKVAAETETENALRDPTVAKTNAQTTEILARAEKARKEIEKWDAKLAEDGATFEDRKQYLKKRNANLQNLIDNRDEGMRLRKAADLVAERLGSARNQANLLKLEQAWMAMNTEFDRYNQSMAKRIGSMTKVERQAIADHKRAIFRQLQLFRATVSPAIKMDDEPQPGDTAYKPPPAASGSAADEARSGYVGLPGSK